MKISKERIEEIKRMLAKMSEKDEDIRMGKVDLNDDIFNTNSEHLEKIIDEIGWPTRSLLGDVAAAQAWSIATYSPDPKRHAKYLALIKASKEMMEEKSYVAHFEDQLRTCSGKPELYGTGFTTDNEGKFIPFPIESLEGLNDRRKSMNLDNYETFLARIERLNNSN